MEERGIRTLARGAQYPDLGRGVDGQIYGFDGKIDAADLARARAEARRLGLVMGNAPTGAAPFVVDARWIFADPAYEDCKKEVPAHLLASTESFVHRGACALVRAGDEWTYAQHLAARNVDEWLEEKRTGAGRDPRLATPSRADDGRPLATLKDQLPTFSEAALSFYPFAGPRSRGELLRGIAASGLGCVPYHTGSRPAASRRGRGSWSSMACCAWFWTS